jgi:hypothetical protein
VHKRVMIMLAVASIAAAGLASATQASAADKVPTSTVLAVDGNTSDVALALKDVPSAQYPQDHAKVALSAKATWVSETGVKDVPGGDFTYYQNGENIGSPESVKLKACVTTFKAVYSGVGKANAEPTRLSQNRDREFAGSTSQTVTVTLVGGHCTAPTPTPTPTPTPSVTPTDEITPTPTVTTCTGAACQTPCGKPGCGAPDPTPTITVTATGGATTVVERYVVTQAVPVPVYAPAAGTSSNGGPTFTG